jgi:hypothetical protein
MHPGVGDLSHLTDNEVEDKIIQLSRYYHTCNDDIRSQIILVIDTYKIEQETRRLNLRKKEEDSDENGLDNLINIS